MSFFDDTKNFGIVALIIGIIMVINAIIGIVAGVDGGVSVPFLLMGIGSLAYGLLVTVFGLGVKGGEPKFNVGGFYNLGFSDKFGCLVGYVATVGLGYVISGVFGIVAGIFDSIHLTTGIINIVIAVVILYCVNKMKDGQVTTADKIIWLLLAIMFVLMIVSGLGSLIGSFAFLSVSIIDGLYMILTAVCYFLIAIFALLFLFSPEVKSKLGM